jgi:hypothetical protein
MLRALKVHIKIKVNTKIGKEAELVSKESQNTNILNAPRTNTQNMNNPWNSNIPSP